VIESESHARDFCAERVYSLGMERLERLAAAVRQENERQNLVSTRSVEAIWQRHFADSVQLVDHIPRGTSPWLDLGSGAGFPGLVLAIARPEEEVVLVESRKRRVDWLGSCVARLQLSNCRVIGSRLETVVAFPAAVIVARAFAPLDKLLRLSARFSTPATMWLLPKGRSAAQELHEQPARVRSMFHVEPSQTDPAGGIIVGQGRPSVE
jgi:16S rRNA (guanine527-N7)-methyltransferase